MQRIHCILQHRIRFTLRDPETLLDIWHAVRFLDISIAMFQERKELGRTFHAQQYSSSEKEGRSVLWRFRIERHNDDRLSNDQWLEALTAAREVAVTCADIEALQTVMREKAKARN